LSVAENKELVVRFYQALERGEYDVAGAMCDQDFVFYSQVDTPRLGVDGFLAAEKKHLEAFRGFRMTIDTVGEADRVAAYVVFEGTQSGAIYGIAPQGKRLRMSMCNLFTIRDGKVVETRAHYDRLDHIEQLQPDTE
jgi:steroid delta-isomerase-like uncharacterized protein